MLPLKYRWEREENKLPNIFVKQLQISGVNTFLNMVRRILWYVKINNNGHQQYNVLKLSIARQQTTNNRLDNCITILAVQHHYILQTNSIKLDWQKFPTLFYAGLTYGRYIYDILVRRSMDQGKKTSVKKNAFKRDHWSLENAWSLLSQFQLVNFTLCFTQPLVVKFVTNMSCADHLKRHGHC